MRGAAWIIWRGAVWIILRGARALFFRAVTESAQCHDKFTIIFDRE